MEKSRKIVIPHPIIDDRERRSLTQIQERYEKLCEPTVLGRAGKVVSKAIPKPVKQAAKSVGASITEQQLFTQMMEVLASGFGFIEERAARYTIPRSMVIKKINSIVRDNEITTPEEFCLARGYDIAKLVDSLKNRNVLYAFGEGSVTGFFGFWGLAPSLLLSIFLYYRAVQTVALYYGYDVKENPEELIIASDVFMNSMSPSTANSDEISNTIVKFLAFAEAEGVKQTVKKTYAEMISRGGASLLIVQIRALANKAAQKAIDKAGVKSLENTVFKQILEQIGKKLSKRVVAKAVPIASSVIGGVFDLSQMKTVINYADVFYNKRFLVEKKQRVESLSNEEATIEIVDYVDISESSPQDNGAESDNEINSEE